MVTAGPTPRTSPCRPLPPVAGATVVTPPGAQPWGYSAVFADPDQHTWMVTVDDTSPVS